MNFEQWFKKRTLPTKEETGALAFIQKMEAEVVYFKEKVADQNDVEITDNGRNMKTYLLIWICLFSHSSQLYQSNRYLCWKRSYFRIEC